MFVLVDPPIVSFGVQGMLVIIQQNGWLLFNDTHRFPTIVIIVTFTFAHDGAVDGVDGALSCLSCVLPKDFYYQPIRTTPIPHETSCIWFTTMVGKIQRKRSGLPCVTIDILHHLGCMKPCK